MNIKRLAILGSVVVIAYLTVAVVWAAAPWSLFGRAVAVRQGQGPDPWAIQLESRCPSGFPSCLSDGSFTFSGVAFREPQGGLTFANVFHLSTDFNRTNDDCGGGSPRFQLNTDMNGNGVFDPPADGNVFVYFGPLPNFTGCSPGWQSTGNLIGIPISDTRYDLTQVGGTFYDTYANALTLLGSKTVPGIQLVVDSGWNGPATGNDSEQTILVDNVRVNDHHRRAHGFRP